MPVTPSGAEVAPSYTVRDIVTNALRELDVISAFETPSAQDAELGRQKANDLLDEWAARKIFAFNVSFTEFTLTPGHSPHLIGPGLTSPDFAVAQRPVRVQGATLVLNTSQPEIDIPLNIRDDDWWNNQRVKSLQSAVPTDLYYSPDFPNGSLYCWPVPSSGFGLRLQLWGLLSQFAKLDDPVVLAPGYRNAITLSLAENLAGPFKSPLDQGLMQRAQRARNAIQSNNLKSPRIQSADAGTRGRRGDYFNWQNGQPA